MQQAGLPSAEEVRSAFAEVLAGRDFQRAETPLLLRWIQSVLDAVDAFLRRWWPDLQDSHLQMIYVATFAVVVAGAAVMALRWAKARGAGRAAAPPPGARPRPRDAAGWAALARAAAAEGRYREAATGVYQATVLHLDSAGKLRYREWKTPGDYALEASGRGAAPGLTEFLARFVEMAFGPREPTSADFDALSQRATRLGSPV
ncbi:MAG TPA: DUF4129 domain-containing protein [Longimicrobiales bacterium]|nr:DUF4129 domain-containing protein [Longimicrobiales bacterium]